MLGPPGSSKTQIAKAVAISTDAYFIQVVGSKLVQRYIGMGAKMVRELFQVTNCACSVVSKLLFVIHMVLIIRISST